MQVCHYLIGVVSSIIDPPPHLNLPMLLPAVKNYLITIHIYVKFRSSRSVTVTGSTNNDITNSLPKYCVHTRYHIKWENTVLDKLNLSARVCPGQSYGTLIFLSLLHPPPHIVRFGHLEVVKYLIEVHGCSTGCTNNHEQTPLHYACW